jgi:hypothetical protein
VDSLITAAARALAAGDPLGALKRVALRDDAPAIALRSIAMSQLGDLVRAKALLRGAARAFGPREAVALARCVVAEAERTLADLDPAPFPPTARTAHEVVVAGIAMRRLHGKAARAALARAADAAHHAGIRGLRAEVESTAPVLNAPAARLIARRTERVLMLDDVETLLESKALVVDACRRVVRQDGKAISLATRPCVAHTRPRIGRSMAGRCRAHLPREARR